MTSVPPSVRHERGAETAADEECDRQAVRRDAGVAGAHAVAAHGEDPVAIAREVQDEPDDEDGGDPPEESHFDLAADIDGAAGHVLADLLAGIAGSEE